MSRLPDLSPAAMSPEQKRVHDMIASGPRGRVEGPLRVWLHSPELAERAQALGAFCRYGTTLPPRLSELAILITGAHWRAGFEWHIHAPIAIAAGIAPAAAEALRTGAVPRFAQEDEAAVHAFASELLRDRTVSDATFARARAALGDRGVVDLVGVLGYYGFISMTINGFAVALPEGAADPFAA
ncbi:MAG: carboxymuconolactone decarboxylase family protein [Rhodospirillales bacterium]|nr:carboxymuconolactone decarboxylase family protein [Rhodospirillales bacterium]